MGGGRIGGGTPQLPQLPPPYPPPYPPIPPKAPPTGRGNSPGGL